eukprot:CAMPEP_0202871872 /NCGR_PEP_ID=MMETSP1391-20130828/19900_1 /ASSEMBLY_ACC=CAM_ASM_000867 /TAXON_ID=1034604 /ORGANISM="Chlamydomonas leiostraca, Strain SAG 11-49" /LENGTH=42 /DNA_ID= /DNA_START= /DNA_END= /DNA_ORIENTATION=
MAGSVACGDDACTYTCAEGFLNLANGWADGCGVNTLATTAMC